MNEFGFIEQRWPWALVVTLVLAASLIYLERLRLQRLTQLLKTVRSRIRPSVFIALIIIFILAFAVARPYFGYEDITIKTSGSDTILVVDVSQSMLTRDVQPSRLELAKRKVLDIVERVSTVRNGDRLGLVLFAGASYLYCPLTSDYSALGEFARAISTELVTAPGSAVNLAVATALQAFENATASTTPRILILSDGEDSALEVDAAAALANKANISLNVIGFGTISGKPIELKNGSFLQDRSGEIVISKLNRDSLERLASSTGGSYYTADPTDRAIAGVFPEGQGFDLNELSRATQIPEQSILDQTIRVYHEYGPLLLWIPGIAFLIALLMGNREILFVFVLYSLLLGEHSHASESEETAPKPLSPHAAYKRYRAGDYERALRGFEQHYSEDAGDIEALQSLASSYYKLGEYAKAAKFFRRQTQDARTGRDKFAGHYGLGNSYFQQQDYKRAIEEYEQALDIKEGDEKTEFNLELARKLLKEQEKRQEQEQEQDQEEEEEKEQDQEREREGQEEEEQRKGESESQEGEERDQDQDKGQDEGEGNSEDKDKDEGQGKHEGDVEGAEKMPQEFKALEQSEAEAWLDSMPEAPALLLRQTGEDRNTRSGQTW